MKASIGKLWMLLVLAVIICSVATEGRRSPFKKRCSLGKCRKLRDPVCASDGTTWSSKCSFKYYNCYRFITNRTIDYEGECKDKDANAKVPEDAVKYEAEDVDSTLFGDNNSAQLMKTEGRRSPVKGCKRCRTKIYQPVCVSNGQTWQKCPFQYAKCVGHRNFVKLTIRHIGECKDEDANAKVPEDAVKYEAEDVDSTLFGDNNSAQLMKSILYNTEKFDDDDKETEGKKREDDDVDEAEDDEKEDDDVEEAEDEEKEDDDVEEPEDEEEDDGEGDFNPDSFELEAEGIPVEVVREETKIIRAVEGGECTEENPKACCQYCNMCGTCKEKCGDSAEVQLGAARTPHLRFCAYCSRCSICKTICANL